MLPFSFLSGIKRWGITAGKCRYEAQIDTDSSGLDTSTWSPTIHELVNTKAVEMGPYNLELDYDYWNYSKLTRHIFFLSFLLYAFSLTFHSR